MNQKDLQTRINCFRDEALLMIILNDGAKHLARKHTLTFEQEYLVYVEVHAKDNGKTMVPHWIVDAVYKFESLKVLEIAKDATKKDTDVLFAFEAYCDRTMTSPDAHCLIDDICLIRPHLNLPLVGTFLAAD